MRTMVDASLVISQSYEVHPLDLAWAQRGWMLGTEARSVDPRASRFNSLLGLFKVLEVAITRAMMRWVVVSSMCYDKKQSAGVLGWYHWWKTER